MNSHVDHCQDEPAKGFTNPLLNCVDDDVDVAVDEVEVVDV